jgi:predicted GIY-YIG superfamily endonuclease
MTPSRRRGTPVARIADGEERSVGRRRHIACEILDAMSAVGTSAYRPPMPYTSMLRCSDGSYYVGSTWQLETRIDQHQMGRGAEYTKRRLPVELVYAAEFDRIDEAFAWEKRL